MIWEYWELNANPSEHVSQGGKKVHGLRHKFGTTSPGLFREPIAVLGHDSVRRKMPGPINLTFSPARRSQEGGALGRSGRNSASPGQRT